MLIFQFHFNKILTRVVYTRFLRRVTQLKILNRLCGKPAKSTKKKVCLIRRLGNFSCVELNEKEAHAI